MASSSEIKKSGKNSRTGRIESEFRSLGGETANSAYRGRGRAGDLDGVGSSAPVYNDGPNPTQDISFPISDASSPDTTPDRVTEAVDPRVKALQAGMASRTAKRKAIGAFPTDQADIQKTNAAIRRVATPPPKPTAPPASVPEAEEITTPKPTPRTPAAPSRPAEVSVEQIPGSTGGYSTSVSPRLQGANTIRQLQADYSKGVDKRPFSDHLIEHISKNPEGVIGQNAEGLESMLSGASLDRADSETANAQRIQKNLADRIERQNITTQLAFSREGAGKIYQMLNQNSQAMAALPRNPDGSLSAQSVMDMAALHNRNAAAYSAAELVHPGRNFAQLAAESLKAGSNVANEAGGIQRNAAMTEGQAQIAAVHAASLKPEPKETLADQISKEVKSAQSTGLGRLANPAISAGMLPGGDAAARTKMTDQLDAGSTIASIQAWVAQGKPITSSPDWPSLEAMAHKMSQDEFVRAVAHIWTGQNNPAGYAESAYKFARRKNLLW